MTTEGRRADDRQGWKAIRHLRARCFGWAAIVWMMAPFASESVLADSSRCNCSQIVGTCRATIQFRTNRILIESSRLECSKVTWYTNGQPRTSIVLDGEENIEWLGSTPPSIEIQSCEVCVDRSNPYDRDTAFSGSATQATLVAIPPPEYPAEYRRIGLEGRVVVAFQVDVMGRARNVRVVDSPNGDPNGFWLASVSSALQAANFVPARRNGKAVDSEKQMAFRFKLEDAPPPSPPQ